jgi:hypothetical protein
MTESCTHCKGIICINREDGTHLMSNVFGGIVHEGIKGLVANCQLRREPETTWEEDIEKWYELYGKIEKWWLGC